MLEAGKTRSVLVVCKSIRCQALPVFMRRLAIGFSGISDPSGASRIPISIREMVPEVLIDVDFAGPTDDLLVLRLDSLCVHICRSYFWKITTQAGMLERAKSAFRTHSAFDELQMVVEELGVPLKATSMA